MAKEKEEIIVETSSHSFDSVRYVDSVDFLIIMWRGKRGFLFLSVRGYRGIFLV